MPEGLSLVVVSGSKVFTLRWVKLGWASRLLSWLEVIEPTDNSDMDILEQQTFSHTNIYRRSDYHFIRTDKSVSQLFWCLFLSASRQHLWLKVAVIVDGCKVIIT